MRIILDIPNYDGDSLDVVWENCSKYAINIDDNNVVISANKGALVSIAKQMLVRGEVCFHHRYVQHDLCSGSASVRPASEHLHRSSEAHEGGS